MQKEIGRIEKSGLEVVVVALSEYKGKQLVDIRTFADFNRDGHKPTQKGVSMPVEKLRELKRLVDAAVEEAVANRLIPG